MGFYSRFRRPRQRRWRGYGSRRLTTRVVLAIIIPSIIPVAPVVPTWSLIDDSWRVNVVGIVTSAIITSSIITPSVMTAASIVTVAIVGIFARLSGECTEHQSPNAKG